MANKMVTAANFLPTAIHLTGNFWKVFGTVTECMYLQTEIDMRDRMRMAGVTAEVVSLITQQSKLLMEFHGNLNGTTIYELAGWTRSGTPQGTHSFRFCSNQTTMRSVGARFAMNYIQLNFLKHYETTQHSQAYRASKTK